jgi:hypothetical protein
VAFTKASGNSEVSRMVKGRILRVQSSVEVSPVASVTVRVKFAPGSNCAAVATPTMPAEALAGHQAGRGFGTSLRMKRPAGKEPLVTDQVYGAVPPVAVRGKL